MKTQKHPKELTDAEAEAIVAAFDDHADDDYEVVTNDVLAELRAAAAERRDAESRIESAALAAHRRQSLVGSDRPAARYDPPGCSATLRASRQRVSGSARGGPRIYHFTC
ncbi:MAG: hypothetical protein R2715_03555 [Ilumatobacteraceae bacterium]